MLLELKSKVDVKDYEGETPLSIAIKNGLQKCSFAILKKTTNFDYKDQKTGNSLLHLAVMYLNESFIKALFKKRLRDEGTLNFDNLRPSDITENKKIVNLL